MKRLVSIAVIAFGIVVLSAVAAAAAGVRVNVAVTAGKTHVPSSGAGVTIRATTSGGTSCTWISAPRVAGFDETEPCNARMAKVARVPKSTSALSKRLTFTLRVSGGGTTASSHVVVTEAADASLAPIAAVPTAFLVESASAAPSTGSTVTFTFSSTSATTCYLASSPQLWSTGANPLSVGCNGSYVATVGAASSAQQWTVTFVAVNALGQAASSSQILTQSAPPAPSASLSISAGALPSTGGSITLSYSSTNAATCTLGVTPTLWSGSNPMTVNCNGTYQTTIPSTSASSQQWTFTFTATNVAGVSASSAQALIEQGYSYTQSLNWSGYAVSSGATVVSDVIGSWTVPTLNCSSTPNAGVSEWVGTGGDGSSSGNLLQTGTVDECVNGSQQNQGWWEEVPNNPNYAFNFSGFPVSAGDTMVATVFETNGGGWETALTDNTTGLTGIMITGHGYGVSTGGAYGSYSTQGSSPSTYSGGTSAEWIVEDYTSGNALVTLANFGTVTFGDLGTSISGWSLTNSDGIEIVNSNDVVLSVPSSPTSSGFSVTYTN